jgi:large subunit ribosomal protein L23
MVASSSGRSAWTGRLGAGRVVAGPDRAVERAARNLRWVGVLRAEGLNTYDVLRHQRLLVTRDALDAIHARLGGGAGRRRGGVVKVHQIIQRPLVTEKSTLAREERNEVTFAVDPARTSTRCGARSRSSSRCSVEEVRTMRMPRKMRRVGRFIGARPQWKKAVVRLAEGQSIEFFEGV